MINNKIYNHIEELEDNRNYKEAVDFLIEIYNKHPEENQLLLRAAINAIDLKNWEMFINIAEDYLEIDDKERQIKSKESLFMIYHHLGVGYALKEDYKNAIIYFQNAIKHKAKDNTISYLAQCYEYMGENDTAIKFWTTAAKMGNGEAIMALNSRGISF